MKGGSGRFAESDGPRAGWSFWVVCGVCRAAHTLRGGSLLIGAEVLAGLCEQLEHGAQSGRRGETAELVEVIDRELSRVRMAVAAEFPEANV